MATTDIVWKTVTLPDAVFGSLYEAGLAVTGNADAVSACVVKVGSGSLPPGLAIAADFVRITGTPTASGVYTFKLTMTDTAGGVDSGTFTIHVRDGYDVTPGDACTDSVASQLARAWPDIS